MTDLLQSGLECRGKDLRDGTKQGHTGVGSGWVGGETAAQAEETKYKHTDMRPAGEAVIGRVPVWE